MPGSRRDVSVSRWFQHKPTPRSFGLLLVVLLALSELGLWGVKPVEASIVLFNSGSGVTKPEKKKKSSNCPENMKEITEQAFKHAMRKDVYESKKPASIEAFSQLNFSSCAVLGNGGTLKTTKYGKSIDSHEVVFRANQAPVKGYESQVGSKTTFRILNKRWLGTYSAGVGYLPLEKGVFLTTSRGDQKVVDTLYRKHEKNPKVNVITMSSKISGASRKVLEEFKDFAKCKKKKSFHGGSTISSGLYEVFMALALCERVTVYGFGNGGHGLYQYYKFRNTERRTGDSVHSFDAEKALVMQLERDGFLKTCFGHTKDGNDCGNQFKAQQHQDKGKQVKHEHGNPSSSSSPPATPLHEDDLHEMDKLIAAHEAGEADHHEEFEEIGHDAATTEPESKPETQAVEIETEAVEIETEVVEIEEAEEVVEDIEEE